MERLSISEVTTYRWTFDEDVQHYAAAGIGAIGVWRPKLSDFGEERGAELLHECGLSVSNLLWAGGFTGSEGRSHAEAIHDGADAVRLAANLRAGCLVVYSGPRNGHTQRHARRLFVGAMKELLPLAAELGVTLAVEPTHACCAAEWSFLNDVDGTLDVLAEVDSPWLKLAFDTYHLGHDANVLAQIGRLGGRIAVVHLADSKRRPAGEQDRNRLGEGALPLREMMAELSASGYTGYYDVELMGEEIEASDYTQLIESSKRVYAELVGAAAPGRA